MARVLFCWLAACLLGLVSGQVGAQPSGIVQISPEGHSGGPPTTARVMLLTGAVQGSGQWVVRPVPAAGPRLLLVYHPYSARVTVARAGGPAETKTVFDRQLDPRFSRRALVFPFEGDQPLVVSVQGARYPLQVQVLGPDEHLATDLVHVRVVSVVVGVLVGIALVVILFWLLLRERVYLLYSATMALQLLYLLCAYGEAYALPGLRELARFGAPGIWTVATLSTVVSSLFLIELADLDTYTPRLSRLLRWIGAWTPALLLVPLWLPWPADKSWFPNVGNLLLLVANVLGLLALANAWRRGNRRAAYALLAWVPLVVLSTARAVQLSTGAPLGPAVEYGLPVVLALAAVLLVLILADRMLAVRRERDDAQAVAERDVLTGVFNRQGIERQLEREMAEARHTDGDLSLLFLDLDHFKQINDTHGHAVGDACLRAMVRASVGEMQHLDTIGRLGGEEFLVLLPGSNRRHARDAAERIRRTIETRCATVADRPVALTLSIGVAEFGHNDTREALLRRADQVLYEAKRSGRNRVVVSAAEA